ncbi:MAG: hypothetical protein ACX939_00450 [Hyphococcus sp.]
MNKSIALVSIAALLASGCADMKTASVYKRKSRGYVQPTLYQRADSAANTCEAQYAGQRQNYLSAVQTVLSRNAAGPNPNFAPLERFREEINASYNSVVMRCKTHVNCLEIKFYDEAACYMAATDYKDAERRFEDLSQRLREIERNFDVDMARQRRLQRRRPDVNLNVYQYNDQYQSNTQRQWQRQDNHTGDIIEDQDVLVLCGEAGSALDQRCGRRPCDSARC